ncbi:hypothetical protein A2V56_01755 [Candidatus Woesebacteria bacterium RBG_19FT_COMBO_42_9]|uniref:Uncharacterized protein n=1 Tax=Candidatus Woesebacteria bacterium RBG_16_42_24 TaxID=1802485 RepID=A0A1F7XJS4_9BACT|nr:MAG: hypothetical protein A2V97_01520 [Candidatus Woesebacteria bacterium RBG_16_42_24]OGM17551.1 MAG: hypothetical protein A2V56_01755 [Candidatus Woesebacteria bacterium RBG_19FT_COMBO_42_9]OGM67626.1 MAG: hypothetical protein A2985_00480 [Candidatus Woesebacteria bacterium RIFCSPLOWO2_01_FULL_43_11]
MKPLEFGPPTNFQMAIYRLPDRSHPLYLTDEVFEHLVHFKEALKRQERLFRQNPESFLKLSLEARLVPFSSEDLTFLEGISLRRDFPPILVMDHETLGFAVGRDHTWDVIFETGDEAYGWWEIYHMSPDPQIPDYNLVCIKYAKGRASHSFPPKHELIKPEDWEIEAGFVSNTELMKLLWELRREDLITPS